MFIKSLNYFILIKVFTCLYTIFLNLIKAIKLINSFLKKFKFKHNSLTSTVHLNFSILNDYLKQHKTVFLYFRI